MTVRFEYTVELVGNELVVSCPAMPEEWRAPSFNYRRFRGIGGSVASIEYPEVVLTSSKDARVLIYLRGEDVSKDNKELRTFSSNPDRDFSIISNLLREFVDAAFVAAQAAGFRVGVLKIETLNRITVKLVDYD